MRSEYTEKRLLELNQGVPVVSYPNEIRAADLFPARRAPRMKYPPGSTTKICMKCRRDKPLEAFSELKTGALGRAPRCKECLQAAAKEYHRLMVEKRAGRPRSSTCECCGMTPMTQRAIHMDHDHKTGAFRGWLCHGCNAALGNAGDDLLRLRALVAYIEKHQSPA